MPTCFQYTQSTERFKFRLCSNKNCLELKFGEVKVTDRGVKLKKISEHDLCDCVSDNVGGFANLWTVLKRVIFKLWYSTYQLFFEQRNSLRTRLQSCFTSHIHVKQHRNTNLIRTSSLEMTISDV